MDSVLPVWDDLELADLEKAYFKISQDPIVGTDQTGAEFYQKLFETFCSLVPSNTNNKQLKVREVRPLVALELDRKLRSTTLTSSERY